jgi:acetyltransferase
MFTTHFLRAALLPRSIAVVGASERPESLGRYVFDNVVGTADGRAFQGEIYAVNPRYSTVQGRPCFASLRDLPDAPDLAVVVTPASTVPALMDDAGARGVRCMLILSAGFGETGEEGKRLQETVLARARALGIRVLGPNCLGLMRPDLGLNATFARTPARPGTVALVSQSGAIVAALLDYAWTAGFGFSSVVSTGGGSDVEFSEILDFLAIDAATRSIVLYVEGVHDARAFVSSVRAASSAKPVVVLKVGRHMSGSLAAMSHTGALVGNDAVFDAALVRTGAVRVAEFDQLFAAAQTLASGRLPRVRPGAATPARLTIVTNGGGPGVLAADHAADAGVALARLAPQTIETLNGLLPATWSRRNPVDVIGDASAARLAGAVEAALADPNTDGVLLLFCPTIVLGAEEAANALLPAIGKSSKPVVSAWLGDADAARGRAVLERAGVPAVSSPEKGIDAFAYLARFVHQRELRLQVPPPQVDAFRLDLAGARRIVERARASSTATRILLDEYDSKALLACFGIPTTLGELATSAEQAVAAATRYGFPVALKVRAEGVTHKSDVGGVLLSLSDAAAVAAGFETIRARVAERAPQARFIGALVQPMVQRPHGRELIVGLARDPVFGPVLSFGTGGITVEVQRDTAVALPPLNRFLAVDMVSRTRVSRTLDAFRGLPAVDLDVLLGVLLRISELACEIPAVHELDINPLVADEDGVIALDARVVLGTGDVRPDPAYSHLAVHPYPRYYERSLVLRDGARLLLRPIRPEDAEADRRFVSRLSEQSIYMRFHAPLRQLTREKLVRFTQIDYDREMAFVAADLPADAAAEPAGAGAAGAVEPGAVVADGDIRGVVRYTRDADGTSCEFGLVVEDAWHGRGLGSALMHAIEDCARERGLQLIYGLVLAENEQMLRLLRARGYTMRPDPLDPGVHRLELRLA